jgi:uncharacterized protein YjbI with pentapeptide repeats
MDAFHRLSQLFDGAITSASAMVVLRWAGMGITAVVVAGGTWWLWWRLPKRIVESQRLKIRDPKARADIEDNLRKTVGQALGGVFVLLGAGMAYLQFSQQQQASHDLLISNQVAKGFEQLASHETVMRLGGIYALEGVMNTSDQYHQPVLEALCAFVRDGTIGMVINGKPTTDTQAALTVIARRGPGAGRVDLGSARIPKADLSGANLTGAQLLGANLTGAYLNYADLSGAYLNYADLSGAYLNYADLSGAYLNYADLTDATVAQSQLDQACGVDAKLPTGLTLKPCPPPPPQ